MKEKYLVQLGHFAFGIAILLVAMPAFILAGNAVELPAPRLYFLAFVILALFFLAVGFFVVRFANSKVSRIVALATVAYAVSVYFSDILFPLSIAVLETGKEVAPAQPLGAIIQPVMFLAMIGLFLLIPSRLGVSIAWLGAVVVAVAGGVLVINASAKVGKQEAVTVQRSAPVSEDFNIYHMVFDGYHGPWLQYAMDELDLPEETFEDFTHYRNTKSSYWYTQVSFPSFMSGTVYDPELSVLEWYKQAEAKSFLNDVGAQGYFRTVYAQFKRHGFWAMDLFIEPSEETVVGSLPLVFDYWTLRVAPVALRPYVFAAGGGVISNAVRGISPEPTGDRRSYDAYLQFQQMIADEAKRPDRGQYVLLHTHIPHQPYQMDRNGNYAGESSYDEQVLLATGMMEALIARLKELDRYEQSLIIFQSDHGSAKGALDLYKGDPLRDFMQIDEATSREMAKVDVRGFEGKEIDARYSALLLIKSPTECFPEKTNAPKVVDNLVRLTDLKKYVKTVLADPANACDFPESEYVDMHHGLRKQGTRGENVQVGREIMSGKINHYRVTRDSEWSILEDIPFQYK